jgi:hypothetical protein
MFCTERHVEGKAPLRRMLSLSARADEEPCAQQLPQYCTGAHDKLSTLVLLMNLNSDLR